MKCLLLFVFKFVLFSSVQGDFCENGDYNKNPIGQCQCQGQYMMNEDCSTAFYCSLEIPDPAIFDGCILSCPEGQIISQNFFNETWECVDDDDSCLGTFHLNCPDNPVLPDLGAQ